MSEPVQLLVVLLIVAACAWRAFRRYAPVMAWRLQARLSQGLEIGSKPAWLRSLGRWLRPSLPAEAGCGSGCSSCGGCAATPVRREQIPMQLMADS